MRSTTRFVVAAWLAAAVGCSDDGLTVQDQNSSDTGVDTVPPGDSTGEANPTTGDSQGATGTASGTGAADSTSDPGTGPVSDDGTTGNDEGPSSSTTEATTEATGATDGSSTTGEACDPITEDPSGIGAVCRGDLDCLEGYTCQPFAGFAFQQTCQILCTMDCECPMGLACVETVDKTGIPWFQCT